LSLTGEVQSRDTRHQQSGGTGHSLERGFSAAFELVATPAVFGLIGYFVDRWLGTGPWIALTLAALVSIYVVWKLWYGYNADMDRLEAERRSQVRVPAADEQFAQSSETEN